MRIGIGLPAAVPGTGFGQIGEWAERSEQAQFRSVAALDRLVYENLDPIVALAAAASRTKRVELLTTVLNLPWRLNAIVVAKQIASIADLSRRRLTVGLALGGWPADAHVSSIDFTARAGRFDEMLSSMRETWAGEVSRDGQSIAAPSGGPPRLLLGCFSPGGFRRLARLGFDGWVAPFFGFETLVDGIAAARREWAVAGRLGRPRIVVERYYCLGAEADKIADRYLLHYYGADYFAAARADTMTDPASITREVHRLADAGCDDLVFFPCSGELDQVDLLADALAGVDVTAEPDL
jgi:alkanesulfonate monooxygenase SsuD/methylene tetrahydromethanopterin reductase-like flavin-dependent oxidoreductase (luciferase family)